MQITDRGSWQTGANMNPAKGSEASSMFSLSRRFFYKAQQQLGSSRAMVVITALGIIQLNGPSVPCSVLPPLFFSLSSLHSLEVVGE